MSYLPSEKSLNYSSINWPNLLDKLMKSDIDGVSSLIDEAMGIFDQMEVLSNEPSDDVVALSDNIERLHAIIEELLDLVGDAAAGKTKAQPQLQQLYQELSELESILAYAPYAAIWIGMNLCTMQKPKDAQIAKLLHSFKVCNHKGAALLKHFKDICDYLQLTDISECIHTYRRIDRDERSHQDYELFLDGICFGVNAALLYLSANGYFEQADLLLGYALSTLSEATYEYQQYQNLETCERLQEESKQLNPTSHVDIGQSAPKQAPSKGSKDDKKALDAFWQRIDSKAQTQVVESAEITDYETLNSRSRVINNLWLRMQNTYRYIGLFRSGAQCQQVEELKKNLYHLLDNDHIPDSDKAMSLERMLERFISVESVKDSALHKELLYLGSSMIGDLQSARRTDD